MRHFCSASSKTQKPQIIYLQLSQPHEVITVLHHLQSVFRRILTSSVTQIDFFHAGKINTSELGGGGSCYLNRGLLSFGRFTRATKTESGGVAERRSSSGVTDPFICLTPLVNAGTFSPSTNTSSPPSLIQRLPSHYHLHSSIFFL